MKLIKLVKQWTAVLLSFAMGFTCLPQGMIVHAETGEYPQELRLPISVLDFRADNLLFEWTDTSSMLSSLSLYTKYNNGKRLVEKMLDEEGYPEYRQEIVERMANDVRNICNSNTGDVITRLTTSGDGMLNPLSIRNFIKKEYRRDVLTPEYAGKYMNAKDTVIPDDYIKWKLDDGKDHTYTIGFDENYGQHGKWPVVYDTTGGGMVPLYSIENNGIVMIVTGEKVSYTLKGFSSSNYHTVHFTNSSNTKVYLDDKEQQDGYSYRINNRRMKISFEKTGEPVAVGGASSETKKVSDNGWYHFEAESGTKEGGAEVADSYFCSGDAYVTNMDSVNNGSFSYHFNSDTAGVRRVRVYYCSNSDDRILSVSVNGRAYSVACPNNGAWNAPGRAPVVVDVNFDEGDNVITIGKGEGADAPNVDRFEIESELCGSKIEDLTVTSMENEYPLGDYAESKEKYDNNPELGWYDMTTCMDYAYFVTHNFWRSQSSLNTEYPNYDTIILNRTDQNDQVAYEFMAHYTNRLHKNTPIIYNPIEKTVRNETSTYTSGTTPGDVKQSGGYFFICEDAPHVLYDGEDIDAKLESDTGEEKNFHFSVKGHTQFEFHDGDNQYFEFWGDDDVYVFVNRHLVMDLGGAHDEEHSTLDIQSLYDAQVAGQADYGLVDGEAFDFDLFYLERHSTASNFYALTNLKSVEVSKTEQGQTSTEGKTSVEAGTTTQEQTATEEQTTTEVQASTEESITSSDWKYKVLGDDGTISITGYTGIEKTVVIPEKIDGKTVKEIGEGAFNGNNVLTEIRIPETTSSIGKEAFDGCTGLEEIRIPESVTSIAGEAFNGCSSLKNVFVVKNSYAESWAKEQGYTISYIEETGSAEGTSEESGEHGSITEAETDPNHIHSLDLVPSKAATCTENGNYAYYICTVCGRWFEDEEGRREITRPEDVIVPALGHDWGEWVVIQNPTDKVEGIEQRTCRNDATHMESKSIAVQPISIVTKEETVYVQVASVEIGTEIKVDGLLYQVTSLDKHTVECKGLSGSAQATVRIFKDIDINGVKYKIQSIAKKAFRNQKGIQNITVGSNVERICESAFQGCSSKLVVDLKNNKKLKYVEKKAFSGVSLKKMKCPKKKAAVYQKLAEGCKKGEVQISGKGIYRIISAKKKQAAYLGCTNASAKSVSIPSTIKLSGTSYKVTVIGKGALKGNSKLKKLTVGNNVTKVEADAITGCNSLKEIRINTQKLKTFQKCTVKMDPTRLTVKANQKVLERYGKLLKKNLKVITKK